MIFSSVSASLLANYILSSMTCPIPLLRIKHVATTEMQLETKLSYYKPLEFYGELLKINYYAAGLPLQGLSK